MHPVFRVVCKARVVREAVGAALKVPVDSNQISTIWDT